MEKKIKIQKKIFSMLLFSLQPLDGWHTKPQTQVMGNGRSLPSSNKLVLEKYQDEILLLHGISTTQGVRKAGLIAPTVNKCH